ncbi:MAG: DUF308 domain-containing protein [Candidatus Saccharimonadales bacterium]|jgi:hypothetical protein
MYGKGIACSLTGTCALLLPDTQGNSVVRIFAVAAIVVGVAILVSSIARAAAKRAYKA